MSADTLRGHIMLTAKETARRLRKTDLLKFNMNELAAFNQALGQSGRGSKSELVERLHKRIWSKEYDNLND